VYIFCTMQYNTGYTIQYSAINYNILHYDKKNIVQYNILRYIR